MIQCPYCRTPLTETTPACPKCSLDLARAGAVLGPVPRLSPTGITDLCEVLQPGDEKRLLRELREFHRRFPQSQIAVILSRFDRKFPLGAHLFWLFNTIPISGGGVRRGSNRDLLVGIDPERREAALTMGYGLEPFLSQETLDHVLDLARPHLAKGNYLAGILDIIAGLTRLMEGVCRQLGNMMGLEQNFVVIQEPGDY